jgi:hypothetical protein
MAFIHPNPYAMKQKQMQKDHGRDLYQAILLLIGLLGILWYLNV